MTNILTLYFISNLFDSDCCLKTDNKPSEEDKTPPIPIKKYGMIKFDDLNPKFEDSEFHLYKLPEGWCIKNHIDEKNNRIHTLYDDRMKPILSFVHNSNTSLTEIVSKL